MYLPIVQYLAAGTVGLIVGFLIGYWLHLLVDL